MREWLGAAVLFNPLSVTSELLVPLPTMVKGWIFFYLDLEGFLGGEKDGVSHLSHLTGFLSIILLIYFLSHEDKRLMQKGLWINMISFILFVAGGFYVYRRWGGLL